MQLKPAEPGSAGFGKSKGLICAGRTANGIACGEDELAAGKGCPQALHGACQRQRGAGPDSAVPGLSRQSGIRPGGLGQRRPACTWQSLVKPVDQHDAASLQGIGQGRVEQGQATGHVGCKGAQQGVPPGKEGQIAHASFPLEQEARTGTSLQCKVRAVRKEGLQGGKDAGLQPLRRDSAPQSRSGGGAGSSAGRDRAAAPGTGDACERQEAAQPGLGAKAGIVGVEAGIRPASRSSACKKTAIPGIAGNEGQGAAMIPDPALQIESSEESGVAKGAGPARPGSLPGLGKAPGKAASAAADRAGEAGCRTWDSRPIRNKRTWDSLRGAGRGGRNRKGHARKDAGPPAPAHGLDEAGQKARQPVQKAALLLPASAGHEPGRTR